MERGDAGPRQVVGVDVAGVDVVGRGQHRRAAGQALARIAAGAVEGVDAGHTQDRHGDAAGAAEDAPARFRIGAPARPFARRPDRARLVDEGTAAIAVDAAGRGVDEPAQAARSGQRADEPRTAQIDRARAGRRREVQHGVGEVGEAGERSWRDRGRRPAARCRPRAARRRDPRSRSAPARANGLRSKRATRRPTSPQPTISSTGLLKRVGRSGTEWEGLTLQDRPARGPRRRERAKSRAESRRRVRAALACRPHVLHRHRPAERQDLQRRARRADPARGHPPGRRPALRLPRRRLRLVQVPDARGPRHPRRPPAEGAQRRGGGTRA